MAQPDAGSAGTPPPAECQSARQLLDNVIKQIAEYDAKKLSELKTELDAFVKKEEGLVKDYKAKYPDLRQRWCAQQTDVHALYLQLKATHDPAKDQWKTWVTDCICKPRREVDCLEEAIANRKRCCYGPLEYAKDLAKRRFDAAKTRLDVLSALVGKLDTELGDHAKWITEIKNLAGPERVAVLYSFWFKLLPAHRWLMPADLGSDCAVPGADEAPPDLCKDVWGQPCPPDPGACKPSGTSADEGDEDARRRLPWLMLPGDYEKELDCAWEEYRKRKNELATAEAQFKDNPDDLATRTKQYTTRRDGLEAEILACLKKYQPDDPCCGDSDAEQKQGA
jgi:hypothetical protein